MPVRTENHFNDFRYFLKTAKAETLEKIGNMMDPRIAEECPKRTGTLARAGYHDIKSGTLRFINDMHYAAFVALGTMYMSANPWPLRAIHKNSTAIAGILVDGYTP